EGAISGAVLCMVLMPLYCYIYSIISANAGTAVEINYLAVICIAPVVAVMAMMGDLSASVIKRQCGVKDFGSIMPGHGGVMDRFDSVLFVAPTLLIYAHYLPLIAV
ncbi:MAG: phosphatidate cytidylyltransferase, partial [Oscillospiraceae bacterium]|nr:phosphatidate cytidylyltransferase [Oscillospiraceae bacterium]